jgi:hypothetical protein
MKNRNSRREHQQTQSSTQEWPSQNLKIDNLIWADLSSCKHLWARETSLTFRKQQKNTKTRVIHSEE